MTNLEREKRQLLEKIDGENIVHYTAKRIVDELERQIDTPFKSQDAREVAMSVISFFIKQYILDKAEGR